MTKVTKLPLPSSHQAGAKLSPSLQESVVKLPETIEQLGPFSFLKVAYLIFVTNGTNIFFFILFFLAGVNFYRFNAKNWQFTVYFGVITQKIGNFLCIMS